MTAEDILQHERVLLRALEHSDLELLYEWENDTAGWKVSNTLEPFSKYTLGRFIENAGKDIFEQRQLRMMIVLRETGNAIGAIDLFDFDPHNLRAGVGIIIGEKSERKKGYASEALEILISYAAKVLMLKQLFCNITEDNDDSLKLFISKHFTITGKKIAWLKTPGGFKTEYFLQLQLY